MKTVEDLGSGFARRNASYRVLNSDSATALTRSCPVSIRRSRPSKSQTRQAPRRSARRTVAAARRQGQRKGTYCPLRTNRLSLLAAGQIFIGGIGPAGWSSAIHLFKHVLLVVDLPARNHLEPVKLFIAFLPPVRFDQTDHDIHRHRGVWIVRPAASEWSSRRRVLRTGISSGGRTSFALRPLITR